MNKWYMIYEKMKDKWKINDNKWITFLMKDKCAAYFPVLKWDHHTQNFTQKLCNCDLAF